MSEPCLLQSKIGHLEACPEDRCTFWDDEGCVLDGLSVSPELAERLLELRSRLEAYGGSLDRLLIPPGLRNRPLLP